MAKNDIRFQMLKEKKIIRNQEKIQTCVKYLKASTTGAIISLYASICMPKFQQITFP
jgi:hypothetical protein